MRKVGKKAARPSPSPLPLPAGPAYTYNTHPDPPLIPKKHQSVSITNDVCVSLRDDDDDTRPHPH